MALDGPTLAALHELVSHHGGIAHLWWRHRGRPPRSGARLGGDGGAESRHHFLEATLAAVGQGIVRSGGGEEGIQLAEAGCRVGSDDDAAKRAEFVIVEHGGRDPVRHHRAVGTDARGQ